MPASSPYARAPKNESTPANRSTNIAASGEGFVLSNVEGIRKIAEPMTLPTTIEIASNKLSVRASPACAKAHADDITAF